MQKVLLSLAAYVNIAAVDEAEKTAETSANEPPKCRESEKA